MCNRYIWVVQFIAKSDLTHPLEFTILAMTMSLFSGTEKKDVGILGCTDTLSGIKRELLVVSNVVGISLLLFQVSSAEKVRVTGAG